MRYIPKCFTLDLTLLLLSCFLQVFLRYQQAPLELAEPCVNLEDAEEMRHLQWPVPLMQLLRLCRKGRVLLKVSRKLLYPSGGLLLPAKTHWFSFSVTEGWTS